MGFNVLAGFTPLGEGSTIMDLEDFIVSNNLLPLGSLGYVLFCTKKNGWGWNHFLEEINQGEGWKFPSGIKGYMSYGLPLLIIIIYLKGYYDKFQPMGTKVLVGWMIVAILFLTFVIGCSCGKSNAEKVDKYSEKVKRCGKRISSFIKRERTYPFFRHAFERRCQWQVL